MVIALFPLALGAEPGMLARIAPGVLWVAVLLAGMLTLDSLFRSDLEDGSLEQLLLSPVPLAWLIATRVAVHWTVDLAALAAADAAVRRTASPAPVPDDAPALLACAGHPAAQPDRRGGRRAHRRNSPFWYALGGARLAAFRAGSGVRLRCGGSRFPGTAMGRRDLPACGWPGAGAGARAAGRRDRATHYLDLTSTRTQTGDSFRESSHPAGSTRPARRPTSTALPHAGRRGRSPSLFRSWRSGFMGRSSRFPPTTSRARTSAFSTSTCPPHG